MDPDHETAFPGESGGILRLGWVAAGLIAGAAGQSPAESPNDIVIGALNGLISKDKICVLPVVGGGIYPL